MTIPNRRKLKKLFKKKLPSYNILVGNVKNFYIDLIFETTLGESFAEVFVYFKLNENEEDDDHYDFIYVAFFNI